MKKAMMLAVCLVLAGLLAVNGTFALPDLDKVFATLADFLGAPTVDNAKVDVELVSGNQPQPLYPGSEARSYTTAVQSKGTEDVYYRLAFAVQYDPETWEKLDIGFAHDGYTAAENWRKITASNGKEYQMKVFTYLSELKPKTTSAPVTITIGMDESITSEQLSRYGSDFLQVQVLAVGTEDFTNKNMGLSQALDAALPLNSLNPF